MKPCFLIRRNSLSTLLFGFPFLTSHFEWDLWLVQLDLHLVLISPVACCYWWKLQHTEQNTWNTI